MFCRLSGWALIFFGDRAVGWPYLISAGLGTVKAKMDALFVGLGLISGMF